MNLTSFKLSVSPSIGEVTCILNLPERSKHLIVLSHGAGAGMEHPFMKKLSEELAGQRIATLRFQFPYMEQGKHRPDKPEVAHQTIKAAYQEAIKNHGGLSIFLGGKSYGGRMSSQAVANKLIEKVSGVVFYGFPLHAAGKPSVERGDHLFHVNVPMLFCQGSRDKLAEIGLIKELTEKIGDKAEIYIVEEGDHSFNVQRSLGVSQNEVIRGLTRKTREWIDRLKG
jgi:uncharacterized protein